MTKRQTRAFFLGSTALSTLIFKLRIASLMMLRKREAEADATPPVAGDHSRAEPDETWR